MTGTSYQLTEKISEICVELKRLSLWKSNIPDWVNNYYKAVESDVEFSEWLQFVYLPNLLHENATHRTMSIEQTIVPQAIQFFGEDVKKGKLLQLLIELDSLS